MPRATNATPRPDLGQIAYEYDQGAASRGFIANLVAPVFRSGRQSGTYPIITAKSLLGVQETERAERSGFNRDDYKFDSGDFATKEHGLEEPIDDRERDLYEESYGVMDLEEISTMRLMNKMARAREKRVADMVMSTSVVTNTDDASVPWSTHATADPLTDVNTARASIKSKTGLKPNALIIGEDVFLHLVQCQAFLDHIKYTSGFLALPEEEQKRILSQYLGVQILVGDSVYDSANKNKSLSVTDFWDPTKALLARLATNPRDLREPCLARTFQWDRFSTDELYMESYREEQTASDVLRARHDLVEKTMFTDAAYLLTTVTA